MIDTFLPQSSMTNSVQGITWRLAFGVVDPTQPEGEYLLCINIQILLSGGHIMSTNPLHAFCNIAFSGLP